jgi:alpha-beta hydrolase superfamily lysophospholipase
MRDDTFLLPVPDGTSIFVYRWLPDGEPRAAVQIAHGMAEHAGRYAPLAAFLTDAGFAVYADDHRGHGRTVTSSSDFGVFAEINGWNKVVEDLRTLHLRIREEHPGLPVIFLGHSMGSFLGRRFAASWGGELAGLALSGTGGPAGALEKAGLAIARWRARAKGRRATSRILQFMSFGAFNKPFAPNRTGFDWLSREDSEVDAYLRDPHCGFPFTCGAWVDFLEGLVALDTPAQLERVPDALPVYLFSGALDPVSQQGAGVEAIAAAYRAAGLSPEVKLYPGARHEILNEINRAEVFADLLAWMERALSG